MINFLFDLIEECQGLGATPSHWVMHPVAIRRLKRDTQREHWSFSNDQLPQREDGTYGEDGTEQVLGIRIEVDEHTLGVSLKAR